MTTLVLILVFYIIPLIYFLKVAYDEEDGMFILLGVIPALNFLTFFLIITVEGRTKLIKCSTKLIKWIKYR